MNTKYAFYLIGIGRYISLIDDLVASIIKYAPHSSDCYFTVFTDCPHFESSKNIIRVKTPNYSWPGNTLYRYKLIKDNINLDADLHFFCNANLIFQSDRFFKHNYLNKCVYVRHPGYVGLRRCIPRNFEYNSKFSCSMRPTQLFHSYVQGTLWGGHKSVFGNMCRILHEMVEFDSNRGLLARVHDESYLNWLFHKSRSESFLLGPEFCWPEEWQTNRSIQILSRDKRNHFGSEYLKKMKS